MTGNGHPMERRFAEDSEDDAVRRLVDFDQGLAPPDPARLAEIRARSTEAFLEAAAGSGATLPIAPHSYRVRIAAVVAAAALVLLTTIVAVTLGGRRGDPRLALLAAPAQLAAADTIHLRIRRGDREDERWIDLEGGRWIETVRRDGAVVLERRSDGERLIVIDHDAQQVERGVIDKVVARALARAERRVAGGPLRADAWHDLRRFERTGRERAGDAMCDVWQRRTEDVGAVRRLWIGARDGALHRVELAGEPRVVIDVIGLDGAFPAVELSAAAPSGYDVVEAPPPALLAATISFADAGVDAVAHTVRTLSDGAVLLGLDAADDVKAEALTTIGAAAPEITLAPVDIATTRRGDRTTRWVLFVPERPPPARSRFYGYRLAVSTSAAAGTRRAEHVVHGDLEIERDDDFDRHVRGAVAARTDSGIVPASITRAHLAETVREITLLQQQDPPGRTSN